MPEGSLSSSQIHDINEKYKGILVLQSSGTDGHMWTGATALRFLEQLTIELRKQRQKYNLDSSSKAMVICDRCTSHLCRTFTELRKRWAHENNVFILGMDPEADVQIPGGWGLSSQPNDAWHGHFHMLRATFMRAALRMPLNPLHRKELSESEVAPGGSLPSISCPIELSFAADAFALTTIGTFKAGKTILWAWMSRGYLGEQEAADWHFGSDVEKLRDHMKGLRDGYRDVLRMSETPVLDKSHSQDCSNTFRMQ